MVRPHELHLADRGRRGQALRHRPRRRLSDRELQELARQSAADPDDAGLGLRYEQALLRAGRERELRQRYRARLACSSFEALAEDPRSHRIRFCERCERGVNFVDDRAALRRYAGNGQGVAGLEAVLEELLDGAVAQLREGAAPELPSCFVLAQQPPPTVDYPICSCLGGGVPRFHRDLQDTTCDPWLHVLAEVDAAERDRRTEFRPLEGLSYRERQHVVTLPATIAKLKRVETLFLYGSALVRIPPEIAGMKRLRKFDTYTSYQLHWYPYELTRCSKLVDSTLSTRAVYGNVKYRPPFPDLSQERGPSGATCSVCDQASEAFQQVWISLNVGTDVRPLLVNACSDACLGRLPTPPEGYVRAYHRGGAGIEQPNSGW